MREEVKNFTAETSDSNLFPSWFIRLSIFSRAFAAPILIILVFSIFNLDRIVPFMESKCARMSTVGVCRGVTVFRIFYHSYISLILFFIALICCRLTDFIFKEQNKFWIYTGAFAVSSYLAFNFLLFKLPAYYLCVYFVICISVLKLNMIYSRGIIKVNSFLRYPILIFFILLPFIAELICPSLPVSLLRNSKIKISNFFNRSLWNKFILYITIGISANILISAFTFYGMSRNISQESISEALFRKAEKIVNGNFHSMQVDAATGRLFACDIEHRLLDVFDLNDLNSAPKKLK